MNTEISILPSGHLVLDTTPRSSDPTEDHSRISDGEIALLSEAFSEGASAGLFHLASTPTDQLPNSIKFWKEFASHFLSELCHGSVQEEGGFPIVDDLSILMKTQLILNVPPMRGAEYLSNNTLDSLWQDLKDWAYENWKSSGETFETFIEKKAPLWKQVGRIAFHLAENKKDAVRPFAFLATFSKGLSGSARLQYQPLSHALKMFAGAKNKKALIRLLSPVHEASQKSALVQELQESGSLYRPLAWTPAEAYRFLKEVPKFESSGIVVRLPDWWKKRSKPQVAVTIGSSSRSSVMGGGILDFNVRAALNDETLSEGDLKELLNSETGLVLFKGNWVEVDSQRLQETLAHWKAVEKAHGDGLTFSHGMRLLGGAPVEMSEGAKWVESNDECAFAQAGESMSEALRKMRDPGLELSDSKSDRIPGLKAELRPYQKTGVKWLHFLTGLGLGACLADDMGLGKTIQVIGLLLHQKSKKPHRPSLLVIPTSLLSNWKSEIEKFAPTLRILVVHSSEKEATTEIPSDDESWTNKTDVVITTYGMATRRKWLSEEKWRFVILDEAQAIKNPGSKQTKEVKKLKADARIALTGTPVENRLGDLWSLFDFICPGLLGSVAQFKSFISALEKRTENRYSPLRNLVQPYILRRLKTDRKIISDLPDKIELDSFCCLTRRQATLYSELVKELREALKTADGIQRRGLVLSYLMRFKQVCNHPAQLLGEADYETQQSGKFLRLQELFEPIVERQEKALIFSQFREMTQPLANYLETLYGRSGLVLHGGTSVKNRKNIVEDFQKEAGAPFLVLSLKAGGTGLNLTAATHVIHFDRWWNPAVENQATDRAFRIGQKKNVLVHKFVCQGTIEEKIHAMIQEKRELADEILEGGAEKTLTELSDQELIQMVSLDVRSAASDG